MMKRPRPFSQLLYDGDWHSRLVEALELAQESVISEEIRDAISPLLRLLAERDECLHVITLTKTVPKDVGAEYVAECARDQRFDDDITVEVVGPGVVSLTLTKRGSRESAERLAESLVEEAIHDARWRGRNAIKAR